MTLIEWKIEKWKKVQELIEFHYLVCVCVSDERKSKSPISIMEVQQKWSNVYKTWRKKWENVENEINEMATFWRCVSRETN